MKKEDNEGIAGKQEFHTIASNKKKGGGDEEENAEEPNMEGEEAT